MVRASVGAAAPAMRGHRRSRTAQTISGPQVLSDPGAIRTAGARQRRGPVQAPARERGAELLLDHHGVRHAGRHHAVGAGAGDLLSGRRTDRPAAEGDGRAALTTLVPALDGLMLGATPKATRNCHERPETS